MKKFKIFDFYINVALITGVVIYLLMHLDDSFYTGYFVVGGWQVISILLHEYNRCFTYKGGSRKIYHWITLFSVLTMPFGSFWVLLFIAPFMAVWYTYLCYHEVYVKMQRPLAVLK